MPDDDVPVVIVGGSLVGLSMAVFLGAQGVPSLVVERHPGTAIHPRAALVSQRTVELFRALGLQGEIDALTAPELAAFLIAQLVVAQVVVVNLDGVRFLSSAGLRALFEANEFATREDRDLRLVCNSQTANWALETTGLREHFTFTDKVPRRPDHVRSSRNSPMR